MDQSTVTFWLSVFGACISAILAIMKVWEFVGARRLRFKLSRHLTGSSDVGNTIDVVNASGIPAHVGYFDLVWVEQRTVLGWRIPFNWKIVAEDSTDDPGDPESFTIPSHASRSFWFGDEHHFDWGASLKQDIYLRLYVIGRNAPVWLWVTGPSDYA